MKGLHQNSKLTTEPPCQRNQAPVTLINGGRIKGGEGWGQRMIQRLHEENCRHKNTVLSTWRWCKQGWPRLSQTTDRWPRSRSLLLTLLNKYLFNLIIILNLQLEFPTICILKSTLNVRSWGKQLVLFSRESWDSREKKTNWFPEGFSIKCFVIFLDFTFNSNKRITGENQNSWLSSYKNTNLVLKTIERLFSKALFLILSASFSTSSCCFSSGITLKIFAF